MWHSLGMAALFGALGIVLSIIGFKLFDLVEMRINFSDEIKRGNVAVAILCGSFIVGICIVIGRAIGS